MKPAPSTGFLEIPVEPRTVLAALKRFTINIAIVAETAEVFDVPNYTETIHNKYINSRRLTIY